MSNPETKTPESPRRKFLTGAAIAAGAATFG